MVQVLSRLKIMTTDFLLLDEKDFQNQQELILKQELIGAIIGNRCWASLKDRFGPFATVYRRLKLDSLVAQRALEYRIYRAVKTGDSIQTNLGKVEVTFSYNNNRL